MNLPAASRPPRALLLSVALAASCLLGTPAAGQAPPPATAAVPAESEGQIDGQRARFVAQGDDVLISAAEADRIGLSYRSGKRIDIGGTPLWLVTLASVTVSGQTRLAVTAGVVPDVADYFAALHAHPAEAFARSREIEVEINGQKVPAYDLGEAGVLLAVDVAERAGVKYQQGTRRDVGAIHAWVLEMPVKSGAQEAVASVTVTEPRAYFEALLAAAGKPH
jgi:hypothetical protein